MAAEHAGLARSDRGSAAESPTVPREEKERQRDVHALSADRLLFGVAVADPGYAAAMSAAAAHATMAVYWQSRIEWEHGVGF
jgi:hypothetical protein